MRYKTEIKKIREELRAAIKQPGQFDLNAAFAIVGTHLPSILSDFDTFISPRVRREFEIMDAVGVFYGYEYNSEKEKDLKEKIRKKRYPWEDGQRIKQCKTFLEKRYERTITSHEQIQVLKDIVDCRRELLSSYDLASDTKSFLDDLEKLTMEKPAEKELLDHARGLWTAEAFHYYVNNAAGNLLVLVRLLHHFDREVLDRQKPQDFDGFYVGESLFAPEERYLDYPHNALPDFDEPPYEMRHLIYFDSVFRRAQREKISFEEALYIYDADRYGFGIEKVIDIKRIRRDMHDDEIELSNQWREIIPLTIRDIVHAAISDAYAENPRDVLVTEFLQNSKRHFVALQERYGQKIRADHDRHIASIVYLMTRKQYFSQHDPLTKDCDAVLKDLESILPY